jgi:nitrite reductase (NADH) small subunit
MSEPHRPEPHRSEPQWLHIGHENDVPVRGARVITSSHGDLALFRTADGRLFALRDRCPHKGGPLSQGIVHGHSVTCPLHGWAISLETGEAQGADKGCARTIPLKLDKGQIFLDATALKTMAA